MLRSCRTKHNTHRILFRQSERSQHAAPQDSPSKEGSTCRRACVCFHMFGSVCSFRPQNKHVLPDSTWRGLMVHKSEVRPTRIGFVFSVGFHSVNQRCVFSGEMSLNITYRGSIAFNSLAIRSEAQREIPK